MTDRTAEQIEALKIAREMIDAGIPVFACPPNPDRPGQYFLPRMWERTQLDPGQIDRWQPGWALGAVGGHTADFLDFDPRNGGDHSLRELEIAGQVPRVFGVQETPSGGLHYLISPTGERKSTGFMPGVDLQSGSPDGEGRGFVYIAPTVRPSKAPESMGELREYRWSRRPDLDYLAEFDHGDDSSEGLRDRLHAYRSMRAAPKPRESAPGAGSQLFGSPSETRTFTMQQAQDFLTPYLDDLERARIGQIEEHANVAAAALSHFVPSHWTADFAYAALLDSLSHTAYDPSHPASTWSAEKFRAVLDGRRPPLDNWRAVLAPNLADAPPPAQDAVASLLAEMLSADDMQGRPNPEYLIKGLLNLDTISWMIGEPGSKKSFVVLDMAASIVRGHPWRGRKVRQGNVVIIAAEGAGGLSKRIRAYQAKYGRIGTGLYVLPRPVQSARREEWAVLVEACKQLDPVMVVADTQARVTVGLKENVADEMSVYIDAVEAVKKATGACVLSIHHTGRNGADARGSSAIDGAQDTELKVVRTGPLAGLLRTEKQKDLEMSGDVPLIFEQIVIGQDQDGDDVTSLVLIEGNAFIDAAQDSAPEVWEVTWGKVQAQLLKVLRDQGQSAGMTKAEARASIEERFYKGDKLPPSSFYTAWNGLAEKTTQGGETYVTQNGSRYIINPVALSELTQVLPSTDA